MNDGFGGEVAPPPAADPSRASRALERLPACGGDVMLRHVPTGSMAAVPARLATAVHDALLGLSPEPSFGGGGRFVAVVGGVRDAATGATHPCPTFTAHDVATALDALLDAAEPGGDPSGTATYVTAHAAFARSSPPDRLCYGVRGRDGEPLGTLRYDGLGRWTSVIAGFPDRTWLSLDRAVGHAERAAELAEWRRVA